MNTQYAAYTGVAIWGVGATPDEAIRNSAQSAGIDADEFNPPLLTREMTHALAADVESRGGDLAFDELDDGRLGMPDDRNAERLA